MATATKGIFLLYERKTRINIRFFVVRLHVIYGKCHAYHTDPINGGGNGKDTTSTTTEKPDSVDTTVPQSTCFSA